MASFALAFHAVFSTCKEDTASDKDLYAAFGTFWFALLTTFESMLGSFDFDLFREDNNACSRPQMANDVMAILLLNLLIAVLSTVRP